MNTLLPGQPTNLAPQFFWHSPKSHTLKFNSGAAAPALHGANSCPRSAPDQMLPPVCPPVGMRPTAYFAAFAHAEEAIPQHLHGAGPGGVDESPSEDVRQVRHRGGTHVSGPSKAHREETRGELCGSRKAAELAAA